MSLEKQRNFAEVYNLFTIAQLQEAYPYVQWLRHINHLLENKFIVEEDEIIVNTDPNYFAHLPAILSRTTHRTIANYMMWRLVMYSAQFLNKELYDRHSRFIVAIQGLAHEEPYPKKCVSLTTTS